MDNHLQSSKQPHFELNIEALSVLYLLEKRLQLVEFTGCYYLFKQL